MDTDGADEVYSQEDLGMSEQLVTDAIKHRSGWAFGLDIQASAWTGKPIWIGPERDDSLAGYIRTKGRAWNAAELAQLLDLSPKHIYRLAKEGRMPSIRIGGAIRFDPQATADWLVMKTTG